MAAANLHDDLKLSSSSSNSSRSDSDSSSDGEIRDEEKAVKKKAKNIKTETEEGEMDEAVKRFCEAKLKEVKSVLGVELETLITMRAHAAINVKSHQQYPPSIPPHIPTSTPYTL